jgi:hypothetical protein
MINQLVKPNSFGRKTYFIDLEKVYKITIDEDDKGGLIVKNYRRGIFTDKLLYSFTHSSDWTTLIPLAMEKLRVHTNSKEKQYFTDGYWKKMNEMCLNYLPK